MPYGMYRDLDKWFSGLGEQALREIGIKEGQNVLDFGCGSGNYTLPIAKILGDTGVVYALDQDSGALDHLMGQAQAYGLTNIKRIDTSGGIQIPLAPNHVDFALLYDIFWYFPLHDPQLPQLLLEIYRILKPQGILSVFPKHVNAKELCTKIKTLGFRVIRGYSGLLYHYHWLEHGQIMNFQK